MKNKCQHYWQCGEKVDMKTPIVCKHCGLHKTLTTKFSPRPMYPNEGLDKAWKTDWKERLREAKKLAGVRTLVDHIESEDY